MKTAQDVDTYKDLVQAMYKEVYIHKGIAEWEDACGVDVSVRLADLDTCIPEEVVKWSKTKIYTCGLS